MIVLSGGDIVLPDRVLAGGTLVVDGGRIVGIEPRRRVGPAGAQRIDASGCLVVPGFIDVHVHGVAGHDAFDDEDGVARMARQLPRYGVTAFCPTSVACPPGALRRFLEQTKRARHVTLPGETLPKAARVLPAHLESNFLNPDYAGAQPRACLRTPPPASVPRQAGAGAQEFSGQDVLDVMQDYARDIGIVTLAPELPGAVELIRAFRAAGHRISMGHSGADFETAAAAVDAGVRHATHLFNCMTPMTHRAPGVVGAALTREEVVVELICDGHHVHPAMCGLAMAAKGARGVMAITDGTAASGLPVGSTARLGGMTIHAASHGATLADGTLAGSTLTMNRAFEQIVTRFGGSLVDAAAMCASTPAHALGETDRGFIGVGAAADVAVLDRAFGVRHTLVNGAVAYSSALPA